MFRPLLISMFLTSTALADTWTVDDDGKADFDNIQAAVDAASDGDVILVMEGEYLGNPKSKWVVDLRSKSLTLIGEGKGVTTIYGDYERACIIADKTTTIEHFHLAGGRTKGDGGGICFNSQGDLTIKNCRIRNNKAHSGAAVYAFAKTVSISSCEFTENESGLGIITVTCSSSLTISDCTIAYYDTPKNNKGGGVYCSAGESVTITNSEISSCTGVGLLHVGNETINISNTIIANNQAEGIKGNGILTIQNSTIDNNGGGISFGSGQLTIQNSTISNNNSGPYKSGGGIRVIGGNATITESQIIGNQTGESGGGLYASASWIDLDSCTVSNNTCSVNGGGISGYGITINSCTVSNNTCSGNGGGISGVGMTLNSCTLSGNTANFGGGVSGHSLSITDSFIDDNTAISDGGGIYFDGELTINNSKVSNNVALESGGGLVGEFLNIEFNALIVCGNQPNQTDINWPPCLTDWGSSLPEDICIALSCEDKGKDGQPDNCESPFIESTILVPNDYSTIQAAIDATVCSGTTILVYPGVYVAKTSPMINLNGKDIIIKSVAGPESTILDGGGKHRLLECNSNEPATSLLSGFTFINGLADSGGAILIENSHITIEDCIIKNNNANIGGAIALLESNSIIQGTEISSNNALLRGGGISVVGGSPVITECVIHTNVSEEVSHWYGGGGGVFCGGQGVETYILINNCIFSNNLTGFMGGGLFVRENNTEATVINTTFSENTALHGGGFAATHNSKIFASGCQLSNNTATRGGGAYFVGGFPGSLLERCEVNSNTSVAGGQGGGLYLSLAFITIQDCSVINNIDEFEVGDPPPAGGMFINTDSGNDGVYLFSNEICGNFPTQVYGSWTDGSDNLIADECQCPGDITGDGFVNVTDLLVVIDQWGLTDSPADLNFDGIVDVSDLLIVIGNWGECE